MCYHVGRVKVGLCLQLVFRSTCRALTRACPNTRTPCFRTFDPGTRTWPVFAQGGGGVLLFAQTEGGLDWNRGNAGPSRTAHWPWPVCLSCLTHPSSHPHGVETKTLTHLTPLHKLLQSHLGSAPLFWLNGDAPCAARALCEMSAVFHHR